MQTEIEAKLKVDSLHKVERTLAELGGEFLEEQSQRDYYFDDASRALTCSDRCLRVRHQQVGESEEVLLTYKGPREKSKFKTRQEIEVEVNQSDCAEKLLYILGYDRTLVVEKKRRIWRLGGCEVALDEVALLGSFVEIEGPDEQTIAEVQNDLDLSDLPHINESYAFLMEQELGQQRL